MRGNLKALAVRARVTPGTVSRALSGKSGVSEAMRERIQRLAAEMNYTPNYQASALRTGRREGLAIATPLYGYNSIGLLRIQSLYHKAAKVFGRSGIVMMNPSTTMFEFLKNAIAGNCEFLVINGMAEQVDDECAGLLKNSPVKTVFMDGFHKDFDSVGIFRENGSYQAARLLLLGGASRVFFLMNGDFARPNDRLRGITAAFKSLGLPKSQIRMTGLGAGASHDNFKDGHDAAEALLNSSPVDALFCSNDEVAIGALAAIRKAGLRVPEDVRVVGFDNIPESRYSAPPLTTVGQPVEELTDEVVKVCMSGRERRRKPVDTVFRTSLVVRESAPVADPALREEIFRDLEKAD